MTTLRPLDGVRVLVTGASGFLGQHLVRALLALGAEVAALLRDPQSGGWPHFVNREPECADRVFILRGDLLDEAAVVRAAAGAQIVFHLAGNGGGGGSFRSFTDANVTGTCNVVTACATQAVGRLLFASTAAVYGTRTEAAVDEDHPLCGRSVYAASKIAAEALVTAYAAAGAWTATLRLSNVYGPNQSTETVVTTILRQLCARDEIELQTLHPVRDYVHVQDVIDALLAAALRPDLPSGRTLNISSGRGHSVAQLVEAAIAAVRRTEPARSIRIRSEDKGSGQPLDHLVCSAAAARAALGWEPLINLVDGLQASYAATLATR
jgi:nucleoside-diphosphate-sugar epimerase